MNSTKVWGWCWGVVFREGYLPEGQWLIGPWSHRHTRGAAIGKFCCGDRKWWRRTRRKGLVKCVRMELIATVREPE